CICSPPTPARSRLPRRGPLRAVSRTASSPRSSSSSSRPLSRSAPASRPGSGRTSRPPTACDRPSARATSYGSRESPPRRSAGATSSGSRTPTTVVRCSTASRGSRTVAGGSRSRPAETPTAAWNAGASAATTGSGASWAFGCRPSGVRPSPHRATRLRHSSRLPRSCCSGGSGD
ncbi:MAG: hypothetical protein AVDCRST_MAG85-1074, partial [uncultured Solirubrobacteraceae bacterium]